MKLPRQCCTGRQFGKEPKRCYRTEAEAQAATHGHLGLEAYYCRHCGNYHIGHKLKPNRRQPITIQAIRRVLNGGKPT